MPRVKNIIITGNRKGIGRFLTENYLENGYLVAGCSRAETDLVHPNYLHFKLDVSDEKAVKQMVRSVAKQFGQIDALINNAGIAIMNHALLTPYSALEKVFKTNVFGTFLFCRETAKEMMKNKFGRIVNFSTISVPVKLEGELIYASSKAAVESMTQILCRELASLGITVNCVAPTLIKTDLIKNVPIETIEKLIDRLPLKQYGTYQDVLNTIDYFLHENSNMVSGQTIYLGGV